MSLRENISWDHLERMHLVGITLDGGFRNHTFTNIHQTGFYKLNTMLSGEEGVYKVRRNREE